MSLLSKLFGGHHEDPMKNANQYLDQIPGLGHNTYDPYINEGHDADTKLHGEYDKLMSDPTGFINELMKNFKTSEGYNFEKGQLTKELGNTAASGGFAGTPTDQLNQGQAIQGLLSKDMQQFLENALNVYGKGLTGNEGYSNRGYDSAGKLNDILGTNLNQQGSLAFQDAQTKNSNRNDIWNTFGKALGAGIGGWAGGMPGAKVGAGIFGGH